MPSIDDPRRVDVDLCLFNLECEERERERLVEAQRKVYGAQRWARQAGGDYRPVRINWKHLVFGYLCAAAIVCWLIYQAVEALQDALGGVF